MSPGGPAQEGTVAVCLSALRSPALGGLVCPAPHQTSQTTSSDRGQVSAIGGWPSWYLHPKPCQPQRPYCHCVVAHPAEETDVPAPTTPRAPRCQAPRRSGSLASGDTPSPVQTPGHVSSDYSRWEARQVSTSLVTSVPGTETSETEPPGRPTEPHRSRGGGWQAWPGSRLLPAVPSPQVLATGGRPPARGGGQRPGCGVGHRL